MSWFLLYFGHKTYLGTGEALIAQAIDQGRAAPQDCLLKLLLTALTLGAGLKGGEIVPCFAIGASFGCVVGPLLGLPGALCRGCWHGFPLLRGDKLPSHRPDAGV